MDVHAGSGNEGARAGRWWRALAFALAAVLTLGTVAMAEAAPGRGGGPPAGVPAGAGQAQGGPPVTVMTRNLYLGSELVGLFAAGSAEQLVAATSEVWANVLASDFPARAELLAAEVAEDKPLLIGLQEVSQFTAVGAGGSITVDFLDILLDALADAGLSYEAVAIAPAFEGTLPAIDPTLGFVQATLLDRDVILVRTDVPPAQLTVLDEQVGLFDAALELPVVGLDEPLRIDRGWGYVDVRVRNREFRFVNTHFEAFDPGEFIRVQQAQELLDGPLDTDLPVVLLGDFNSNAEANGLAYGILTGPGGFEDVWSLTNPGDPGLTCCHDADLRNEEVDLRSRIDLVLIRDGVRARDAHVIGIDPALRTPAGQWPSDHAGVVARVMITAR